jgi:hypothetical protein
VWLDVGREFVVELILQSRDGDVIPIGGGRGPVAHLHFLDGQLRCVGARVREGGGGGRRGGVELSWGQMPSISEIGVGMDGGRAGGGRECEAGRGAGGWEREGGAGHKSREREREKERERESERERELGTKRELGSKVEAWRKKVRERLN